MTRLSGVPALVLVCLLATAACGGVSGDEACAQAVREYGATVQGFADEMSADGGTVSEVTCDTDGDPVAWVTVDHRGGTGQGAEADRLRQSLADHGWRAAGQGDSITEWFDGRADGFTATLETFRNGTLAVTFYSPVLGDGAA